MLIAIDPGAVTGHAVFEDGALVACGLGLPTLCHDVYIELPQIYSNGKARPQDLVTLAVRVGEVKAKAEARGCRVELVWPHEWKGSLSKDIMGKRILSKLDNLELEIFNRVKCAKTKRHNIEDAIGIGLHVLGRL